MFDKVELNIIEENIADNSKFFVDFFQNTFAFLKSNKKSSSTWLGVDNLLNFSPIVSQADFMLKGEQIQLLQTAKKPSLNDVLLNIPQKFDNFDIIKLESFISTPTILEILNLPERLDKIICHVNSFIKKLGNNGKSKINVFSDEEIENFQSITIEYAVKNATSDQCIQWTELLVSEIIEIDENMLNMTQVEIIPDDV